MNSSQVAALTESAFSYARYTAWDSDRGQTATRLVFATHCVPACFGLNGRKVIAWILWMVKMMKN